MEELIKLMVNDIGTKFEAYPGYYCRVPLDCYSRCIKVPEVFLIIRQVFSFVCPSVHTTFIAACISVCLCVFVDYLLDSFFFLYLPPDFLFSNIFTYLAISLSFSLFISPPFYLSVVLFVSLFLLLFVSLSA